MDKFANMVAFRAIAETGSFAEAGRKLNLATSVISKRIKDLEDFLGTQLFLRTTRKVTLTDSGASYLAHTQRLLDELDELESGLRDQTQMPSGTIKLTAPLSFGLQTLAPALAGYLEKYSDVTIRTYLSDRHVDMVAEGYDLAIRIGTLNDPGLIAKKLCQGRRVVCASPDYLKKYGMPTKPSDLKHHNCLSYMNLAEGKSWPFMINGRKVWQAVSGNFLSDNGDLLYQAAISGGGITILPMFIIQEATENKKLTIVLEDYEEKDFDVYAVYQQTRHLSRKIRTLIDHLAIALKSPLPKK